MRVRLSLATTFVALFFPLSGRPCAAETLRVTEDFERDMGRWFTTDLDPAQAVWRLETAGEGNEARRYLRVTGASAYKPPFRSPHSIALLNDVFVGDFELTAGVQNTNPRAGAHRDLCLFWGYQDPAHFYYVHLGAQADPHSCQIFVVDGAPRTKITVNESKGTKWTDGWHRVKVVRRVDERLMEVYFDDMTTPCMTAQDKRFVWGQVGVGTFDDSGNFDDVCLTGVKASPPKRAPVRLAIRPSERGAVVEADGKLFAEYWTKSGHQPAIWPLYSPSGKPLTRSWPMGPLEQHEKDDHPHHHSLWFTHGDVNEFDFWAEPAADRPNTQIEHREFLRMEGGETTGTLATRNEWMADGKRILSDQRSWTFGADAQRRWIDFSVQLTASDGAVTFGDTKEGSFAVRVAGSMSVDEKMGGKIVNSRGLRDADAWGLAAEWVDYAGPVDDATVGIALFSHPQNFRPQCRWHVRTYGLFAANPFGARDFPPGEPQQGAYRLEAGKTLTLRYRALLHDGTLSKAALSEAFDDYAAE